MRPLLSWIKTILASVSVEREVKGEEMSLYSASFENLNGVENC